MHLIRFPNKAEHKRAIRALLEVPVLESLGLPGLQMVVMDEHIRALEAAKVSFTHLSKTSSKSTQSAHSILILRHNSVRRRSLAAYQRTK
jgi:hypothetical protein